MSIAATRDRLVQLRELQRQVEREIKAAEAELRAAVGTRGRYPCGTERAYQRHVRYDEDRDQKCKDAHAAYERAGMRRRKALAAMGHQLELIGIAG